MANRERRARRPSLGALAGVLICLVFLASCKAAGVLPSNHDDADAKSILRALGVDAVDNPPDLTTTNTQGKTVTIDDPDEWQPLKKTYSVFSPKSEATLFGVSTSSSSTNYNLTVGLSVDYSGDVLITDDQSWEKSAVKIACAADVDGLDEFVLLYIVSGSYYLRVYDYATGKYSSALKVSDITPSAEITATDAYHFAKATLDLLYQYLHLRAADVDGDGADELVVCVYGMGFGYYDSSLDAPLSNPELVNLSSACILDACVGDFDADSVDELAVVNRTSAGTLSIYVYETTVGTGALNLKQTITSISLSSEVYLCDPRAVDFDGDGDKDLYCAGNVIADPLSGGSKTYSLSSLLDNGVCAPVGVGDEDGDGKEDLYILKAKDASVQLFVVGLDSTGTLASKITYVSSGAVSIDNTNMYTTMNSAYGNRRALAVGNVDKDSPRVKYTGHQLMFTDPSVVAVLASPPYWSAVADADAAYAGSYTNWETSYGTFTSHSTSNGFTVGASVGCTIKYEQEGGIFGIKLAQFEAELTTKAYINEDLSWSSTIEKSVSYTAVEGEDKVIFTCVPKDVYTYKVLESPDSADVGKTLTLEIPRDYNIYSVTRSFFNENNGVVNDIDASVLTHSYGNPASYPTADDKDDLLAAYGGYESGESLPVGQGNDNAASGVQALEITVASGFEITTEVGVEVEASAGGGGGGASVLADVGFSAGYIGTISTSTGTTFGGTVGYLPTAYYNNSAYRYNSGLFVYPYSDTRDGRQYWIVDYWVE